MSDHRPAMLRRKPAFILATLVAVLMTTTLAVVGMPRPAQAATVEEVTGFGANPGNLRMFRYVPDGLPSGRPVVVAMHGCNQNATGYATSAGWPQLADRYRFAVVFPQQRSANNANSCFNWFEPADTARGSGEALSIKQMVDHQKRSGSASAYASGLSAGGAMAAVLLAAYPDVFSGGGVVAGLPYRCANTVATAFSCMNPGVDQSPARWGDRLRAAFPGYTGPRPKVSIWHGTSDTTVVPANGRELVEQFTNANGTDQTPEISDTVGGHPHQIYGDTVESYSITGMAHGQPVDPGPGPEQCGTAAPWILDVNLCSAYHMARFWGLTTGTPPTTTSTSNPPASTPTTPPRHTETVTATATDHYLAGRVDAGQYTTLGARHGYTAPFPLYRCGTQWTDKADCAPI